MMCEISIRPIIGLEIHVQLATRTKLFCGCAVEFAAEPNSRVCPVCLGLPGSLPVLNRTAFEYSIIAGLALHCRVAPFSKWDRKSYYYPDLPKNYQISQYDLPLSAGGHFDIRLADGTTKSVRITRAHLEEDAGKNLHEGLDHTRVDLNRAGTPLLEIVTEPDLANADEAYTFCIELQRLVRYLGISEADMQKGQMRFEPNINVAITDGSHRLETGATGMETGATGMEAGATRKSANATGGREYRTPISEVKNLNSFRAVREAIRYEIDRQVKAWQADHDYTLENKGKMNFGWNADRGVTEFQRGKEESHDYRYFPDPDLVPVTTDAALLETLAERVGELPLERQRRFMADYQMNEKECEIVLADRQTSTLFEEAVAGSADAKALTKHFMGAWSHVASAAGTTIGQLGISAAIMAELVKLVTDGVVSASAASQIAERLYQTRQKEPQSPMNAAQELGLIQERDESALAAWVDEAFANNPQAVQDAVGSNARKAKAAPGFLRGQVMRISQGKADPKLAGKMIEEKLAQEKTKPDAS